MIIIGGTSAPGQLLTLLKRLSINRIKRRREDVEVRILHVKLSSRSKNNDFWKILFSYWFIWARVTKVFLLVEEKLEDLEEESKKKP